MTSTSDGSVWMFGGVSLGRRLDELLKLDRQAQEWTAIDKYGAWPDAREALAMTSVGLKVVLFGGLSQNDDGEGRSDELWEFDAVTMVFTRLYARGDSASASGPSARFGHAMSAIGTKVFVYGGVTDSIAYANDLWEWDMFTLDWTCLNAEAGVIGTVPSGRQYHTMVAVGTRLFLHGGETARVSPSGVQVICAGDCECPDLSAGEFSGKISDGPGPYSDNANCRWLITSEPGVTITFKFLDLDTGDDQVVTVNRCRDQSCSPSETEVLVITGGNSVPTYIYNSVHTSTTGYLQVAFESGLSEKRKAFEGLWTVSGSETYSDELFTYETLSQTWEFLHNATEVNQTAPSARDSHGMASISENKLVLFGGCVRHSGTGTSFAVYGCSESSNELFEFDVQSTTWAVVDHEISPTELFDFAIVSVDNQVLIHGGSTSHGALNADLWEFDPGKSVWRGLTADADLTFRAPTSREGHTMVGINNRVILFGGGYTVYENDMLGYVSWVQDCRNENMGQQDDLMHEACRGAFGPSATAASEKWWFEHGKDKELGGISSHPPNYLIFTQPLVCSNYEAYSPCIGGYGRNCHSQSMDTLDTCSDYSAHQCGTNTRAALCVASSPKEQLTNELWEYDPDVYVWSRLDENVVAQVIPPARKFHTMTSVGGSTAYIFGGRTSYTCKTVSDQTCHFPFIWDYTEYFSCTDVDNAGVCRYLVHTKWVQSPSTTC